MPIRRALEWEEELAELTAQTRRLLVTNNASRIESEPWEFAPGVRVVCCVRIMNVRGHFVPCVRWRVNGRAAGYNAMCGAVRCALADDK